MMIDGWSTLIDLTDYARDALFQYWQDGDIPDDLYQYGMYTLSVAIPIMLYAFLFACIYKLLCSILEGVKR